MREKIIYFKDIPEINYEGEKNKFSSFESEKGIINNMIFG